MKELMSYLPEDYAGSRETVAIQEAIQPELDQIWQARDDLLLQLNPATATWGLRYWEQAFGLPADETRPLEQRRNRVVARIRGLGPTTVGRLMDVVETFCPGCLVSIEELFALYTVVFHLTVTDESPSDMDGLRAELSLIMPAHLGWYFAAALESTGTLTYGACSEMTGQLEVWPKLVDQWESTGIVAMSGVQAYQSHLEVYPEGGAGNAQ